MAEKAVKKMLRDAGYKSSGVTGCYYNPDTGHSINMYDWRGGRERWQEIAENGRLPQPPRVVANKAGTWWQISLLEGENGEKSIKFDMLPNQMGENLAKEVAGAILELLGEG